MSRFLAQYNTIFRAKRGAAFPSADLSTYHKTITDNIFAESINNFPAKFLPRIASLNGSDDKFNLLNAIEITDGDWIEFIVKFNDSSTTNALWGDEDLSTFFSYFESVSANRIFGETKTNNDLLDLTHNANLQNGILYTIRIGFTGLNIWCTIDGNHYTEKAVADNSLSIRTFGRTRSNYLAGSISYFSIYKNGALLIASHTTGQGDYEYDLIGVNHATWAGSGDRYGYDFNGSLYPNENGYSLWQLDSNPDIQVPFSISGAALSLVAGTNIPTGYAKERDIPAGGDKHNIYDSLIDFDFKNNLSVEAGGYGGIASGGNLGGVGEYTDWLIYTHDNRIRQNGLITKIKVYISASSTRFSLIDEIYLKVWRKDGTTYDLISTSENLKSKMAQDSTNYVILDTPITAMEGDFIGWATKASAGENPTNIFFGNGGSPDKIYYIGSEAGATDFDWEAQSSLNINIATKIYMRPPEIVGIGDSIMQGASLNRSLIVNTDITNLSHQILYQLHQLNSDLIYQNMGSGGNTTTEVLARFQADAIDLLPRYILLNPGLNDIVEPISQAVFISNYTSMLDLCVANDVIPIVLKITPWTAGSDANLRIRDSFNIALEALVETYDTAFFVDANTTLGEFRAGGDVGNLWNIKAAYNGGDGVHLNESGYAVIAAAINSSATFKTIDIFDRSNTAYQTATSRLSDFYKEDFPFQYHISELADPVVYDTFFETVAKDRIFGKVLLDGSNNILRLDEFLSYSAKQVTTLPRILSYCRITDIYP